MGPHQVGRVFRHLDCLNVARARANTKSTAIGTKGVEAFHRTRWSQGPAPTSPTAGRAYRITGLLPTSLCVPGLAQRMDQAGSSLDSPSAVRAVCTRMIWLASDAFGCYMG
jgi:hypothetical protein